MEMINQVLLVNSNYSDNTLIEKNIRKTGIKCKVKVTLNGGHGLLYLNHMEDKIKHARLLILLNMETPIMNGFEFLKEIKGMGNLRNSNIMIVVMKGNLSPEAIEKVRSFGISEFISDPASSDDINKMMKKHFYTEENISKTIKGKKTLETMHA
jgi:CheY-like chemotaxis protein